MNCEECCEKHHRNGKVSYYHQMLGAVIVHPDQSVVIPLAPEPITRQDGANKNDCGTPRGVYQLRGESPLRKALPGASCIEL